MKKLLTLLIFIILISGSFYLYYKEGALPVNRNDQNSKIFVVKRGESLNSIADRLFNDKLIRNKVVFFLIVKKLRFERKIQAGDFRLSPDMDAYQIANNLTHGTLDVWITIIEGLRKEEIAQIISQNLDIPETEFIKYAKEGYLFPDTYLIPKDATAASIVKILENNFDRRFDESLKAKAREKNLTIDEIVTLASIIEREAKFAGDRDKVGDILLKRLNNNWSLEVDATLQYALGYQPEKKTWWKRPLYNEDKEVNSGYNTYKNKGFPPGPISNPGLASLKAVVNADPNTPYWFYVSDSKGNLHFAKSLEEHNENIKKYLK